MAVTTPTADQFRAPHRRGRRRARRSLRIGRAVHLLDIENLTRSTRPTTSEVVALMGHYRTIVPIGSMDQFIVAVNHNALVSVGTAFHSAQLLARSGPDGADQALVEAAYGDQLNQRFDHVVIGSGDHYFAELAGWLTVSGVRVTVISRREALSWQLYAAVPDIRTIDPATPEAA
ncbi:hypothetical protein ACFHYQ_25835 [Sphaerimonospora cavernae]|uniref:NYN domain-containing protein n=1 Tax=Sphaerimonospora cavernae TaxID=1740611 RepID=A0ABV6UC17_9ACTN